MKHEFSVYDPQDQGPRRFGHRKLFKGGGGGSSTTSQGLDPRLYPLVDTFTAQAQQVANTPWQAYTGNRFAEMNGDQSQALNMIRQQAGSGVQGQAESALGSFLQGGQENPFLTHRSRRLKRRRQTLTTAKCARIRSCRRCSLVRLETRR